MKFEDLDVDELKSIHWQMTRDEWYIDSDTLRDASGNMIAECCSINQAEIFSMFPALLGAYIAALTGDSQEVAECEEADGEVEIQDIIAHNHGTDVEGFIEGAEGFIEGAEEYAEGLGHKMLSQAKALSNCTNKMCDSCHLDVVALVDLDTAELYNITKCRQCNNWEVSNTGAMTKVTEYAQGMRIEENTDNVQWGGVPSNPKVVVTEVLDVCLDHHVSCCAGVSLITPVWASVCVMEDGEPGWEVRAGVSLLGCLSMTGKQLSAIDRNPFHPGFEDNICLGKGKTQEEAIEDMKGDIRQTSNSLWT